MSFDEITQSDVTPKKEEITVKHGDKTYTFFANELTYLHRLQVFSNQGAGGDSFSQLVLASITDQDGKRMTLAQLKGLPNEIQEQFFVAAGKVNMIVSDKKKVKRT